jgi:uncharacterized protein YoxC
MLTAMSEQRTVLRKSRHLREHVQAKVATLKFSLTEVAPLSKNDWSATACPHGQRVTVD